jgi:hypothetical protein
MSQTDIPVQQPAAEPLLPIEKKLIAFSLGTGIVLLVLLTVLTRFTTVL